MPYQENPCPKAASGVQDSQTTIRVLVTDKLLRTASLGIPPSLASVSPGSAPQDSGPPQVLGCSCLPSRARIQRTTAISEKCQLV